MEWHRPAFLLPAESQSRHRRRHAAQGDDIETLARKIKLAPERLRQLVDAQNAKVAANREKDAASAAARAAMPSYAKGRHPSQAFDTPPFYAAPACPALTSTLGGIASTPMPECCANPVEPSPASMRPAQPPAASKAVPRSATLAA